MMNKLSINTKYINQTHIFSCLKEELVEHAKEFFQIEGDIFLYEVKKNSKRRIRPTELRDIMTVEIVPQIRNLEWDTNGQRFLEDYEIGESSKMPTVTENITQKLKEFKMLTGLERQHVVDMIRNRNSSRQKLKRKRNDEQNETAFSRNQSVQVSIQTRDSLTQTVAVNLEELNASRKEEDIIDKMKVIASSSIVISRSESKMLMSKSFQERRNFIRKKPFVRLVKERYPLLFCFEEVKNELDRIFSDGKCQEFLRNVEKYAPIIFQNASKSSRAYKKTYQQMEKCPTSRKKYVMQVGSLLLLPEAFKEPLDFLKLQDNSNEVNDYPHISASSAKLKDLFAEECWFDIVVEQITLCQAPSFPEALLCLVSCFYIFDIAYIPACFKAFVAMEKLFLTANETDNLDSYTHQLIKYFQLKAKS